MARQSVPACLLPNRILGVPDLWPPLADLSEVTRPATPRSGEIKEEVLPLALCQQVTSTAG